MKALHKPQSNLHYYIHTQSLVEEGVKIGARTRVWAFAHILTGAVIGEDCNICDHTFIEGKVVLGDRVTIKCGVYLWDGVIAEDDVFIGPAAVFTNDLKPRSRQAYNLVQTLLKQGCSIGANSTILGGTAIGAWSLIGAGSIVTKDVPDYGVVWEIRRNFNTGCAGVREKCLLIIQADLFVNAAKFISSTRIRKNLSCAIKELSIVELPTITNPRRNLTFIERQRHMPSANKRVYYLDDVPGEAVPARHYPDFTRAAREAKQ